MNQCLIESGIQFLTRIKSVKSNVHNLENNLFSNALQPTNVIEFSSETNFGKSQVLLHLIKNAILLENHNSIPLGGLDTNVLFIDTDFHFEILQLCEYIKTHIKKLNVAFTDEDINLVVKKSLENLTIVRCYDSQQLLVTFYSLRNTLTSNPKIKFIILDSIGANYWQDFIDGGLRKMEYYEKKVLSVFSKCIKDFKVLVLYVRPEIFVSKNPAGSATSDYKVRIKSKNEVNCMLEANVISKDKRMNIKSFIVRDHEIVWM